MSDIQTRRVKFLMVNPTDFMYLFTEGMKFRKTTRIIEGLPADAQLVHMTYDDARRAIIMVVESDTYEPVPVTEHPPIQQVDIALGKVQK